jgi:hypothetical protein
MTDDFLDGLKGDWERQSIEVTAVRARLERWRWLPHLTLAAEIAWAVVGVSAVAWFAWMAVRERDLFFVLCALSLAATAPPFTLALIRARLPSLGSPDESPEGLLCHALARAHASEAALRLGRLSCWMLLAIAATFWACEAAGLIRHAYALAFITAFWIVASVAGFIWIGWRTRRIARERQEVERLLAQFAEATGTGP